MKVKVNIRILKGYRLSKYRLEMGIKIPQKGSIFQNTIYTTIGICDMEDLLPCWCDKRVITEEDEVVFLDKCIELINDRERIKGIVVDSIKEIVNERNLKDTIKLKEKELKSAIKSLESFTIELSEEDCKHIGDI